MRLGAEQATIGVVTRVNRTEYTLLMRITDARTGAIVSNSYTNLRMGANYARPRGVKWLMDNQLLATGQQVRGRAVRPAAGPADP